MLIDRDREIEEMGKLYHDLVHTSCWKEIVDKMNRIPVSLIYDLSNEDREKFLARYRSWQELINFVQVIASEWLEHNREVSRVISEENAKRERKRFK